MVKKGRPMDEYLPIEAITIHDLDTLKIVADPLRNQILETLVLEPLTVRQVAHKLGLSPKKLYYHVRLLEGRGLIQVVETRTVSNIIEKVYRATATSLVVAPSLGCFSTGEGVVDTRAVNTAVLDLTREDLVRSLEARADQLGEAARKPPRGMILFRELRRLDEASAHVFHARLNALLRDFETAEAARMPTAGTLQEGATQTYSLTVVFYLRFGYADSETGNAGSE
jgi:DNA-binding transcriptional ArsR family regulator